VFEQEQLERMYMYPLVYFKDYWKANQFKKALRAVGLKGQTIKNSAIHS